MPAVDLTHFQSGFSWVLLQPELTGHELLCRQMHLPESPADQRQKIAEQRLSIYRNNVIHSLTAALAAQFPVVKKLVGEAFFLALARDYVRAQPPQQPSLTYYGETFPDFITGHAHCRPLPYLPDVATLEWLFRKVLHAADEPVLLPQELAALDPEQLEDVSLQVRRATALFSSTYPVVKIREENLKDDPGPVNLDDSIPSNALILRQDYNVAVINLNPSAFLLLAELNQGHSIGASWEAVAVTYTLNEEALPALLATLLRLGVFSGYKLRPKE